MRVKITLRCNECKQRNYNTMKNKKNDPDRLEMKKYCRFCRKHTVHTETSGVNPFFREIPDFCPVFRTKKCRSGRNTVPAKSFRVFRPSRAADSSGNAPRAGG